MTTGHVRHRTRRLWWIAGGFGMGLLLAAGLVYVATQTPTGHSRLLGYTLRSLGRGVQGDLAVRRMDGNLLTGARLYGISLTDRSGVVFLRADSAFLNYNLRTLVTPRIVIQNAVLWNAKVYIARMPGDTLWNYERIFRDTARTPGPKVERFTFLDRVRLMNVDVRVELPFEPDSTLPRAERRRILASALSDSGPVMARRVSGGYVRMVDLKGLRGGLSRIRFAPGTRAGSYFGVDSLAGRIHFYREPIRLTRLQGEVALLNGDPYPVGRVEFRMPRVELPSSRLSTRGTIRMPRDRPDPVYDVSMTTDSLAFRDVRWLYRRFPRDATGKMNLLVETRPEGIMILARNARLTAPGTRVTGSFGAIFGDTLKFVEVDLRARPFRVATLEAMLPEGMPVRGLHIEGVEVRGPGGR